MVIVRNANINDLQQILLLIEQLGYPQSIDELQERFNTFLNNDGYGIAVAEQDKKVVGWIAWSKSILFVVPKSRLRIEGIVVDKKCREQGIGQKLMQHIEDFAQQYKPCVIEVTSGLRRKRDGSHKFYKALGYKNEGYMAKLYLRKEI